MNTSFIERLNLTIRQSSAYLSRRTLSHARVQDTLEAHHELLRCYYNFVRQHWALKFGRETRTPAMQAGLATRQLTLRDIFMSLRRVVLWLSDVRVFADSRRMAAAALGRISVAALWAGDGPEAREQRTLGQQLAYQPGTRRADRLYPELSSRIR